MAWQDLLAQSCVSIAQLADKAGWSEAEQQQLQAVAEEYPLLINPYYLSLLNPADPDDPLTRMSIPSLMELSEGGRPDTSGEASHTILPGLQHKYPDTALILSTGCCAMYCRHCFRKRMVGGRASETHGDLDAICNYIASHKEINNVLISGGDAFLNENDRLKSYLRCLTALPHLNFIRFGTRTPAALPQRITEDPALVRMLREYGSKKQLYVICQFDHPRELTNEAKMALRLLKEAGVTVLNQTVLLRGVNDDATVLAQLMTGLAAAGAQPYYLFQCRPVLGVQNHFQTTLLQGCDLVRRTRAGLSGPADSFRYIMSHPQGKMEIVGCEGQTLLLRRHRSGTPDLRGELLRVPIAIDQAWLPDTFEQL